MIRRFANALQRNISDHGVAGIRKSAVDFGRFVVNEGRYRLKQPTGATNIYERDWDLLILLDCATIDMMEEVADEYEFVTDVGEHTSLGTCSDEWMRRTFTMEFQEEMTGTLHITANTSSERFLDEEWFLHLEEVWRDGWDPELGTIPARNVTDRAIYYARRFDAERTLIHYMQPHLPFVHSEIESNHVSRIGYEGA